MLAPASRARRTARFKYPGRLAHHQKRRERDAEADMVARGETPQALAAGAERVGRRAGDRPRPHRGGGELIAAALPAGGCGSVHALRISSIPSLVRSRASAGFEVESQRFVRRPTKQPDDEAALCHVCPTSPAPRRRAPGCFAAPAGRAPRPLSSSVWWRRTPRKPPAPGVSRTRRVAVLRYADPIEAEVFEELDTSIMSRKASAPASGS